MSACLEDDRTKKKLLLCLLISFIIRKIVVSSQRGNQTCSKKTFRRALLTQRSCIQSMGLCNGKVYSMALDKKSFIFFCYTSMSLRNAVERLQLVVTKKVFTIGIVFHEQCQPESR